VSGVGVVPGLGLKFPRDGPHPSVDLVLMRQLDRQQPLTKFFSTGSNNSVFQNPFTNILPLPSVLNLVMRAVNARFETVAQAGKGLHQSVMHMGQRSLNGLPVPENEVRAPYRLMLNPSAQAQALSDPTIDFRDDLANNIVPGTPIYDVLGLDEDVELELARQGTTRLEDLISRGRKIGVIQTESAFLASRYGDYRLFFKHDHRFMRDEFKPANL
jgi:hypothetical protein